jgi:hypothetical protein
MQMQGREGVIRKEVPLVLVNLCSKLQAGRDQGAIKGKRPGLAVDNEVIAEIHAACPALPAAKHHFLSTLQRSIPLHLNPS